MPLIIADRVRETSATTGTGTLTLDGAVSGYRTFSSGIGNGNTCYYTITLGSDWEVGLGTVSAGQLARTTILKSSNSNNAVNFGAGAKDVFATYPGDKAVVTDNSHTFTEAQTFRASNAIRSEAAATQDAVVVAGRAGGTASYAVTLTPTTLSANRTLTLPNATDTVATIGTAQTFTAAQTFRAASAIRSEAASTQDAVVIAGRAGGTGSWASTITPTTLTANRTITLPNASGTVALLSATQTFTGIITLYDLVVLTSTKMSSGAYIGINSPADGTFYTLKAYESSLFGERSLIGVVSSVSGTASQLGLNAGDSISFQNADTAFGTLNASGWLLGGSSLPSGNALVELEAGGTSKVPLAIKSSSGVIKSTAVSGGIEYDGVCFFGTPDTTSGRGFFNVDRIFRLTSNGSAIGSAISNFFGANSSINLSAGSVYELEAYCYFTKTTAGTVTVTLTTSQTVACLNGTVDYGAAAGGTATGAANRISLFNATGTANAFAASASLTTGVNHAFIIRAIIESNATNASTLTINFTESAGTVTPLRSSFYKIRRIPANNVGNYS